jgi:hypothetical protein
MNKKMEASKQNLISLEKIWILASFKPLSLKCFLKVVKDSKVILNMVLPFINQLWNELNREQ